MSKLGVLPKIGDKNRLKDKYLQVVGVEEAVLGSLSRDRNPSKITVRADWGWHKRLSKVSNEKMDYSLLIKFHPSLELIELSK